MIKSMLQLSLLFLVLFFTEDILLPCGTAVDLASGWDLLVKWVGSSTLRKKKNTLRSLRTGRAFHSSELWVWATESKTIKDV